MISLKSIASCIAENIRQMFSNRRGLPGPEQFLLVALFSSVMIIYTLIILTIREWNVLVTTWPIFAVCLLFAGFVGVLAHGLGSIPWGLIAGYALLVLWLWFPPAARFAMALAIALPSAFYIAFALWRWRSKAINSVWLGCLSSLTLFATSGLYGWADIMSRLHAGAIHQDTLFHAAIASMIKNYGVASTGLNGLVEISYHVFSHRLFAALSEASGAPVLAVYGLAPYALFTPILLFSLSYAATRISPTRTINTVTYSWSLACVLLVLIPGLFWSRGLVSSFLVSESYLVALGLMCVALPSLANRSSSISEIAFAGAACSLAGMSKGSVGLILAALYIAKALFYAENRKLAWLAALAAGTAIVAASGTTAAGVRSIAALEPFHFVWAYTQRGRVLGAEILRSDPSQYWVLLQGAWLISEFVAVHFIVSWIVIARCLTKVRGNYLQQPFLMVNLGAVAFSAAPVFLLNMPAGAVYYFSTCALFVAMPFVIAFVSTWLEESGSRQIARVYSVAAIIAICAFGYGAMTEKVRASTKLPQSLLSEVVHRLEKLRITPINNRIAFSPCPELLRANPIKRVSARPFLYPAVSERVWTAVLEESPEKLKQYQHYGYANYLTPDGESLRNMGKFSTPLKVDRVNIND
jgi:hypothetical protein